MRIFNPNAPSYRATQMSACYRRHEREKRRAYEQRVLETEQGSFTPLVFSTSGGMGSGATVAYKRLASLLSIKREQPYSTVMSWLLAAYLFHFFALLSWLSEAHAQEMASYHMRTPTSSSQFMKAVSLM